MLLTDIEYVPTLAIRPSEMFGLEKLPAATKDRMLPCFLLAPWVNSKELESAIKRIERAYANRPYILDIDRDYSLAKDKKSNAMDQFRDILDTSDAFKHWRQFVEISDHIWPCIQAQQMAKADIARQINEFQNAGRNFCLRIDRNQLRVNIPDAINALSEIGTADFIIILEGGWSRDALTLETWFSESASTYLSKLNSEIPIVVSCTSMPVEFARISGVKRVQFSNHELLDNIARRHNQIRFVYGDWASTRPRTTPGIASKPYDRIDYPTRDAWFIARNKEQSWKFQQAAMEIVNNTNIWDGRLKVWGEEMIIKTAAGDEYGITSAQKNVASRVNIHLHLQAFYNERNLHGINLDEDWED